jgi:hypothetical protein
VTSPPTDPDRAFVNAQLGLTAVVLILLFSVIPHTVSGDGRVRFDGLNTLLTTGEALPQRYSYIGRLFASPFWLMEARDRRIWWTARFNVLVLAGGAAFLWWSLRGQTTPLARSSFTLLLVAGGMMPNHVRDFYGEVFSAVTVAVGLSIVVLRRQRAGWILVVLGVANAPATTGGLLLVALWRLRARRFDGLLAVAAVVVLVLLENLVVRGGFLDTGYARDHGARTMLPFSGRSGFSYPLLLGVLSLVFSFGKGLLFFASGLVLVPRARQAAGRDLADLLDLWMLFLLGLLLVYARWWAWYGGWYWGPRFLLFAVFPSSLALAQVLSIPGAGRWRWPAAGLIVWTLWVGVSGAVFSLEGFDNCLADNYALEHLCWYVPEFSPLFRPLVVATEAPALWQNIWMVAAALTVAILCVPPLTRTTPAEPASDISETESP